MVIASKCTRMGMTSTFSPGFYLPSVLFTLFSLMYYICCWPYLVRLVLHNFVVFHAL
jgi:hypothetical protein